MPTLYQSPAWIKIQSNIFKKEHCFVECLGKSYFCLIKKKKIGPITLSRFQIMGLILPEPEEQELIKAELKKIKKEFGSSWKNIFFQFGIMNEFASFRSLMVKKENFVKDIRKKRLSLRKYITKTYKLKNSFRENMPQSNILVKVNSNDEDMMTRFASNCKTKIRKAERNGLTFKVTTPDQYEDFYRKWKITAGTKGFNTIIKEDFDKLIAYFKKENTGILLTTELNGEMIAGNICLFNGKQIVYLYGFLDRNYANIGGAYYLKYHTFLWAKEQGLEYCDFMGGAPTGFPEHSLTGVSKFKESFGGEKREYYGNYDLVLNPWLYYPLKWLYLAKTKRFHK